MLPSAQGCSHADWFYKTAKSGDFPGHPEAKTPPSKPGDMHLIPAQGAKILHTLQSKNKRHPKHNTEALLQQFDKDFKNGPHQKFFKKKVHTLKLRT